MLADGTISAVSVFSFVSCFELHPRPAMKSMRGASLISLMYEKVTAL